MAELGDEVAYVRHHVKKTVLIFSAMRHFAGELEASGHRVFYRRFDPDSAVMSFGDAIESHCRDHEIDEVVLTWPGEWRVFEEFGQLEKRLGIPVHVLDDDRFVSSPETFARWADGRASLRMEFFYRKMREKTGMLMDEKGRPAGGKWNFDAENRRKWKGEPASAKPMSLAPERRPAAAGVVLERRNRHALSGPGNRKYAQERLRPPYPALDGHRQFRPAVGSAPA